MIKRLILAALFFLVFLFLISGFLIKNKPEEKTLGIKQEFYNKQVRGFDNVYNFDYVIADSEKVFLYFNSERLPGNVIKDRFGCSYLISGGFYDPNFKPIGLLISEGREVSSWQKNQLFNGIFSINHFDTARITREVPQDSLRVALQAGPLVFENGKRVIYKSSVVFERRIVLGVTGENKPIFLAFWSQENFLKGPTLEEISYLIEKINREFGLNIADAMNLDGGTASFFFGNELVLGEVNLVASFFCVK